MPPFSVLHVCMGNICRSPMAERLLRAAAVAIAGPRADELIYSNSAGTGGWHEGEPMNPPAARQVRARGGDDAGFGARRLRAEHLDAADLVLTATADQSDFVASLRPDATPRTFVLGEFGRLLPAVDLAALPPVAVMPTASLASLDRSDALMPTASLASLDRSDALDPDAVYARGVALVAAVDAARAGKSPEAADDLDDPWGRGDGFFTRIASNIDAAVQPLAAALLGTRG